MLITIFPNSDDYLAVPNRKTELNRAFREAVRGQTRMRVGAFALEREPGGRHWLALSEGGCVRLFRPED